MIIGINGYIGAGKDEVARMITFLSFQARAKQMHQVVDDSEYFKVSKHRTFEDLGNWQIKKFAYKLKQMVSLLTGIPVEDLEKQEVKERELGPEWDKIMIVDNFRGTYSEFRSFCEDFNIVPDLSSPVQIDSEIYHFRYHRKIQKMTVRQLLQKLGTDAIRDQVHLNAWVNALMSDYKLLDYQYIEDGKVSRNGFSDYPNWIISDCRFPNEAQAIKDRGGLVWRINRPLDITSDRAMASAISLQAQRHPSETSLDSWQFDYIIQNSGTLEDLYQQVLEALKHFKLIES